MNLQQIQYFLALAHELHFWKTSEKVFITQSALSRHIKNIEQELGFRLFERDKRNVKLTPAGEFLQTEYAKLMTDFASVTRHAKQIASGEIGSIRIGHPASITFSVLPDLLQALNRKHPNVIAQMIEIDATDVEAALLGHHIDIAFYRELAKAKGLTTKLLFTENFAVVVPAKHPLQPSRKFTLSALKDEWFVLPSLAGKNEHVGQLRSLFQQAGFEPKIRFESDFGATLLGLVSKGLGISLMPLSYSHHLKSNVRFIKIPPTSSLYAVWRTHDTNAALQNFLRVINKIEYKGN